MLSGFSASRKTIAIGIIGFILMVAVLLVIFQMGERDRIAFESSPTPICNDMAPLGYFLLGFFGEMIIGSIVGCLTVIVYPAVRSTAEDAVAASLKTFGVTAILMVVSFPLLVPLGSLMISGTGALSSGRIVSFVNDAIILALVICFIMLPGFFGSAVSGAMISKLLPHK